MAPRFVRRRAPIDAANVVDDHGGRRSFGGDGDGARRPGLRTKDAATRTPRPAEPPVAVDLTRSAGSGGRQRGASQRRSGASEDGDHPAHRHDPHRESARPGCLRARQHGTPAGCAACRLSWGMHAGSRWPRRSNFQNSVSAVRRRAGKGFSQSPGRFPRRLLANLPGQTANQGADTDHGIAALTQILRPRARSPAGQPDRSPQAMNLPKRPGPSPARHLRQRRRHPHGRHQALKDRPKVDYDDVLLRGLRYPLASVSRRSAQAMLALNRTDLLPKVAAVLDEAAPGDPVAEKVEGKEVAVVHELVASIIIAIAFCAIRPTQTGNTKCPA